MYNVLSGNICEIYIIERVKQEWKKERARGDRKKKKKIQKGKK